MVHARWRLAYLWFSQGAHFMANYCLRVYTVLLVAAEGVAQRDTAWHLVTALSMLPSVFLVPVYGALGNSLPKRAALVGSAAYCLGIVTLFAWWGHGWLACVAAFAVGSALYTPTRHALLPAAAHDGQLPLARVVSVIETGAFLAIVAGMVLGGTLLPVTWNQLLPRSWAGPLESHGLTVPVAVIVALALISLAAALPVHFGSDVHRPEAAWPALRGFFRDFRRLLLARSSRYSLLAVCALRGLVAVSAGALIAESLASAPSAADSYQSLSAIAILTLLGAAAGLILSGLFGDPQRVLGLVPLGTTGMVLALGWIALAPPAPAWLCVLVGLCGGVVNVPLLSTFQASIPADARGNGMAILNTAGFLAMSAMSLLMAGLARAGVLTANGQLWFVTALSLLCALAAWWALGTSTLAWFLPAPRRADTGDHEMERPVIRKAPIMLSNSPE